MYDLGSHIIDQGLQLFYTLDGSTPKPGGQLFRDPFPAHKQQVQAIVYDPLTKLQCSPTSDGAAAVIVASEKYVDEHDLFGVLV